jgi:outer membrane protein assembly factor BamB
VFAHARRALLIGCALALFAPVLAAADWPQWRGADRSNHSSDAKLLAEWPKDGPPQVWKAEGIGYGVPSVAVAGGKVYVLGYKDGKEHLTALDEKDGKPAWSVAVGPEVKEMPSMRYLSQRAPTVDGDRVYAFTARGELICLATADGKEKWRKDYVKDFGGKAGVWGYCDFPLVDGDNLVCTPGAADATLVALNKKTGEVVWKCGVEKNARGTYGAVVVAEIAGTRQYVHQIDAGVIGVAAKDGKLLWHYPNFGSPSGNVHTALVRGDEVFATCGWGVGAALLHVKKDGDAFKVEEVFRNKLLLDQWIGSSVRMGEFVHTSNGACAKWGTGERVEQEKGLPVGRISMTAADGKLIYRSTAGKVTLVEVAADGTYKRAGEFTVNKVGGEPTWTCPVVANGRLYLRDQDTLLRFDLRAKPDAKEKNGPKKEPDVIFVPTPQDVVEKMLGAVKVTKADVVVDLGCGDGRIVITAAKKYGCKAIGYDLDPECVRLSRAAAKEAGVEKLVRIEEADIFRVDLADATVVALFLGEKLNEKLVPQLNAMKPGSRVVSHVFPIPGVKPDAVLKVTSAEDDVERPVYTYTVPLKAEKK